MKGIFSQGIAILTERPVTLDDLQPLIPEYPILKRTEAAKEWAFGGPTATVAYKKEINGLVVIDTVDRPWPDDMGDPKQTPVVFGAWSMGQFGPFAFPHGLERATEQAWGWADAKAAVARHRGFVRLRVSYVMGGGPDAKCLPQKYNPQDELEFLLGLVRCLLRHPAALCYFNPSGEVVMPASVLEKSIEYHGNLTLPPLDAWTNVRLFNIDEDWLLMDTVGNWQLDIPDHEAVFPKEKYSPSDVANFLRNVTSYVMKSDREIENNDTMDGPGDVRWQAVRFSKSISNPPREVFCWVPTGLSALPSIVTSRELR